MEFYKESSFVSTLVVVVDRARNIPNRKTFGKQDAYCTLTLGTTVKETHIHRRAGQTPQWDDEFRFEIDLPLKPTHLLCQLYADKKTPRLIGEVAIDLDDVLNAYAFESDQWHDLQYKGKRAGSIRLEMTLYGIHVINTIAPRFRTNFDYTCVEVSPPQATPCPLRLTQSNGYEISFCSSSSSFGSQQPNPRQPQIGQPNVHETASSSQDSPFDFGVAVPQRRPDHLRASSINGDLEDFDVDYDRMRRFRPYEHTGTPFCLEGTMDQSSNVHPHFDLHDNQRYMARYDWDERSLGDATDMESAMPAAPERICSSNISQLDYEEYNSNRAFWQASIDNAEDNTFPSSPPPHLQLPPPAIRSKPLFNQLTMAGSSNNGDEWPVNTCESIREEVVIEKIITALEVIGNEGIYGHTAWFYDDGRGSSTSEHTESELIH